jgi:DNA-binding NarL/FixJ family response regulator
MPAVIFSWSEGCVPQLKDRLATFQSHSGCKEQRKEDIPINAIVRSSDQGAPHAKPLLTDREKAIVQLVAQGYRNNEIGEKLLMTEFTVKSGLDDIFGKLGVSDRLELTLYAIQQRMSEDN